eukprot:jgi/Mesvir1/27436/Mv07224-RA.2
MFLRFFIGCFILWQITWTHTVHAAPGLLWETPRDGFAKAGVEDDTSWLDAFHPITNWWGLYNVDIVHVLEYGNVLRVKYPQGSYRPSADPVGGFGFRGLQAISESGAPEENVQLQMTLRLDHAFDCVKTGKLHGLYGGDAVSGGENSDGENGWSVRLEWRQDCFMELYAYIPIGHGNPCSAPANYSTGFACDCTPYRTGGSGQAEEGQFDGVQCSTRGISLARGNFRMIPGTWHNITIHVKMNSLVPAPGNDTSTDGSGFGPENTTPDATGGAPSYTPLRDGRILAYADGDVVADYNGLVFRATPQLGVSGTFLSTFFGGGDESYATPNTTYSYIARMRYVGAGGHVSCFGLNRAYYNICWPEQGLL